MAIATTNEWNLLRRRKRLLGELRAVLSENLMRGSVVESSRKCGRPNCVCEREGKRHTRKSLSVNLGGKTRSVYLDAERDAVATSGTAAYRGMRELVDQLTEVNLALLSLGHTGQAKDDRPA